MNLPNKLTIIRIVLIIPFVFVLLSQCFGAYSTWIALAIFCIASLTDMLDGKIARKYNLITNFGKLMDPLADKVLVAAAMICLVEIKPQVMPSWAVIIILAREFIINGVRLVASDKGVVIAASMWGKCKTVSQMIMIILMLAELSWPIMTYITMVVMWISVLLTVISLVDYVWKNREVLKD